MRRLLLSLVLLTALQAAAAPFDQLLPGTAKAKAASAPADAPLSAEPEAARIAQKLLQAQTQLQQLPDSNKELDERRIWLQLQVYAYQQHLAALAGLASQADSAYKAALPAASQPASIVVIDTERNQLQISNTAIDMLNASLVSQDKQIAQTSANLAKSEVELRQSNEVLEKNSADSPARTAALQAYQLARLKHEALAATLAAQDARKRFTRAQLQNQREQHDQIQTSLQGAPAKPAFSSADLAGILETIGRRQDELRRMQGDISREAGTLQSALMANQGRQQQVRDRLAKLGSDPQSAANKAGPLQTELNNLTREETLLQMQQESNAIKAGLVSDLVLAVSLESAFWKKRYAISNDSDPQVLEQLQQQIPEWLGSLKEMDQNLQSAILVAQNQSSRLLQEDDAYNQRLAQIWQEREDSYSNARTELSRSRLLISRWVAEFGAPRSETTLAMRTEAWLERLHTLGSTFWYFELFSVTDTVSIDGQSVSIDRSVTVGKLIIAILLITAGFGLCLLTGNVIETQLVRRSRWSPEVIRIAKRWLLALAFVILLINSLLLVRIPLAAFTFMGGAIAIGLGFGTQTLLKNLISGLMMLLERPFKPGDTVEVNGLRGTVVDMSVRAAVLRDINGIDTLVPNSTFLEQNVTNWTYSSSNVRQGVSVGVAYGSDIRLVARLLEEDVLRHGQIRQTPKPEILLEDFGPDALMFGVYYWVDLGGTTPGRQIASDLRFMIEASLRKHGITIAYPQRDVHIDLANGPLHVAIDRTPRPHAQQNAGTDK